FVLSNVAPSTYYYTLSLHDALPISISAVLVMKYSSAICLAGDFSSGYQSVTAVKTPISLALLTISQDILDPPKINNFFPFKDFNIISPFCYFSNIIKLYKLGKIQLLHQFF